MKKYIKQLSILSVIVTIFTIFMYSGFRYFNLLYLQQQASYIHGWVQLHYGIAVLLYILLYTVYVSFSLPAAAILTLASGYLFGIFWGTVYTNLGITCGSTISFLMLRYIFGDDIRKRYATQFHSFYQLLSRYGMWYLLFIRLIMVVPLFVANALMSIAPISVRTMMWTTCVGTIPATLIYTIAGEQLYMLTSLYDVFSCRIVAILLAFKVLVLGAGLVVMFMKQRS